MLPVLPGGLFPNVKHPDLHDALPCVVAVYPVKVRSLRAQLAREGRAPAQVVPPRRRPRPRSRRRNSPVF